LYLQWQWLSSDSSSESSKSDPWQSLQQLSRIH